MRTIRVRCDQCATVLREKTGPSVELMDFTVPPCPNCIKVSTDELRTARGERNAAQQAARVGRQQVHEHRRALSQALDLTSACIGLEIPRPTPDDVPF